MLALAVPVLLYAFMLSLRSEPDFDRLIAFLRGGVGYSLLLRTILGTLPYFLADLRHLGFDLVWGTQASTGPADGHGLSSAGCGSERCHRHLDDVMRLAARARRGTEIWLLQRASALLMAVCLPLLLAYVLLQGPHDYWTWRALFAPLPAKLAVLLFVAALLVHGWIGLREILIDYLNPLPCVWPSIWPARSFTSAVWFGRQTSSGGWRLNAQVQP